ncbi:MAG TPA: serine protease [Luteolibacter sp.]|nr:serine protease [Luteolibacter sp.]
MIRHLAIPACIALVACTPLDKGRKPAAAPILIDDTALRTQFEAKMAKLVEGGGATPQTTLNEQLSRSSCKLKLPATGRTPMSPAEIYQNRLNSVVMVAKLYHCSSAECKKVHANIASGVVIHEDGIVLTNYHVAAGKQNKGLGMGVMTGDGKAFLVKEVLAADKAGDVAILRLKGASGLDAAPVLRDEPVGNPVTIISHPAGNFYTLSHGRIARYCKEDDGSSRMYVTADYAKGSSGGPIFNECGDVVGLVSSTISTPYRQLPLTIDPKTKSLGVAGKETEPAQLNGMPLVMDLNHQMTIKSAVAASEVTKLIEK